MIPSAPASASDRAKAATSRALCALGIDRLAASVHARKLLILTYHGLVGTPLDPPCPWHVEEARFCEQMEWLARHHSVVPLHECVRLLSGGGPLPRRPAVVTFDDGYRSVRTRALPILERLGIPATVFLVSDSIGAQCVLRHDALYLAFALTKAGELDLRPEGRACHRLDSSRLRIEALADALELLRGLEPADAEIVLRSIADRLGIDPARQQEREELSLLSDGELAEMAASGLVTFGAHGRSHTAMTLLTASAAREEIGTSVSRVRTLIGASDVPFAYPFGQEGDFDGMVAGLIREAGATCALTTVAGFNAPGDDPFALRRIGVGADLSIARFRLRISGLSPWGLRVAHALLLERVARWRRALRPLRRFWRTWVYRREEVVVFTRRPEGSGGHPATPAVGPEFHFVRASAAELERSVDRLDPVDRRAFCLLVAERFRNRMRCFAIRRGESLVASVWVSEAAGWHLDEIEETVDLGPRTVYLLDGVTAPEYRGKGLYTHLLARVAQLYGDRTKVGAASSSNFASAKGLGKAGFAPLATHRFLRIAGLVLRSRTEVQRTPPPTSGTPRPPSAPPSPPGS